MTAALLCLPFGAAIGACLTLLGGGGSLLAVPVLVYVFGERPAEATTLSLAMVAATALVGGAAKARAGVLPSRVAVEFGVPAVLGAFAGAILNRHADPGVLLLAFGLLLLAAAAAMVRTSPAAHLRLRPRRALSSAATGLAAGFLSGFFGVGGGFVIVPALVLLLGLELSRAVATSLVLIAVTSGAALALHLGSTGVDWRVATAFTGAGVAGALAAGRAGGRIRDERLLRGFALLVAATAVFLIVKNLGAVA